MSHNEQPPPVILLIENEESDVFLFRRALSRLAFNGIVRVVVSVSEARDYLEGRGKFSDRSYYPIPDLIVSDMSLSGASGNDFLEWLRQDGRFNHIPFTFLSGSFLPPDRSRALDLGAAGFFVKTGDINAMQERITNILKFLPPTPPPDKEPPSLPPVADEGPGAGDASACNDGASARAGSTAASSHPTDPSA